MLVNSQRNSCRPGKSKTSDLVTAARQASLGIVGAVVVRANKFAGLNLPLGLVIGCVANGGAFIIAAIKTALLTLALIAAALTTQNAKVHAAADAYPARSMPDQKCASEAHRAYGSTAMAQYDQCMARKQSGNRRDAN